ncbi:L-threonylcarbamoyladenylate synthase [Sporosalibacterium faouarense]|uniref:L-threonylcarbamoyladenylate synthase n=1 Tax=Sporosalibacterium faouarense TaxID=516123 RepID=UPI00141CACD3|nr:L-threonylcarbamoyladenylate synthase [Sporosalibacterium faouarense]MTI46878.1 threonylcarbamoyl-AMP synthase [Bacillota bacterium]
MIRKNTQIIKIDENNPESGKIKIAADVLKKGGLVAFPTETVYGLGANALDEKAVSNIFMAKGRPDDNPLIVHIADISQIDSLVEDIPEKAFKLMERFWPGPLTIIFNRSKIVPDKITGGLSTVAIRMPNHKISLKLIREANLPIAAPSANTSGRPSPTDSLHVIEDLNGKIDVIIEGGPTGIGVESTVLDISGDVPLILRPGGVTQEDLEEVFPKVEYDPALSIGEANLVPKSPGQKYRHYSPKADMIVVEGEVKSIAQSIIELSNTYHNEGKKVGIMATSQNHNKYSSGTVITVGDRNKPETIAASLFKVLRKFDEIGVDIIIAEGINEIGIGKAIMNRMRKAAGKRR